jgi:hypothetical protein
MPKTRCGDVGRRGVQAASTERIRTIHEADEANLVNGPG